MPIQITNNGLEIETFQEILDGVTDTWGLAVGLTDLQKDRIKQDLKSPSGNLFRIWSELLLNAQESLLSVYETLGLEASGVNLDRVVRIMGVTRRGAIASRVQGTATGVAASTIPNGTSLQFEDDGTNWEVIDGPYTIGGGGTVTITLECQAPGPISAGSSSNWIITIPVAGFNSFVSTTQTVVGRAAETDAELRERSEIESFRRAQGPLEAIEAQVYAVTGVTYVRANDNTSMVTDSDGIPPKAINVVVEGGAAQSVADAIYQARPAGIELYGTDETFSYDLGVGRSVEVNFDRVVDLNIWMEVVVTTSTSEEPEPPNLEDQIETAILAYGETLQIGEDVLGYRIAGAIFGAGITGVDNVVVTVGTTAFSLSSKVAVSIRQRAAFAVARIAYSEN